MMRSLDKLIKFIGIALVPIGAVLIWKQHWVLELPMQDTGRDGRGAHRHDPRGAVPADQCSLGREHDAPGPPQGADPRYELH